MISTDFVYGNRFNKIIRALKLFKVTSHVYKLNFWCNILMFCTNSILPILHWKLAHKWVTVATNSGSNNWNPIYSSAISFKIVRKLFCLLNVRLKLNIVVCWYELANQDAASSIFVFLLKSLSNLKLFYSVTEHNPISRPRWTYNFISCNYDNWRPTTSAWNSFSSLSNKGDFLYATRVTAF